MNHLFLLLILFQNQSSDLLDAVNSERGGRHWIDQKPDPPKSPEEQLATFQIEPGSRIELVAAEPMVFDPVWIDFDHKGRLFAAEYTDYPIGPVKDDGTEDTDAPSLSKIVLLEDTNGDGRMDKRTVFADNLTFCHSFMPLMDGILACAQTEILFLKDTDGDNVADVREVWFNGFTPAHPQMQIGCPRWGTDNWIYLTYAPGNVNCVRPGFETDEPVKMPRQDMRFNPLTMKFEPVTGLGQFGNTIDNDGNRFFCTNRNPIMMEMIPEWAAKTNPWVTIGLRHTDVGPSGGDTKVFPLVAMKSNWLSHAGTHTSACGVTAYRGDLWDEDFQHSVFVCEPVGHLVTRSVVEAQPNSPALTARRARPDADFLASTDTWFRPSSLRTGPNGALYLADMYRMWVEHPKFLPPEIAARIDWRAGENRGRLWRIVPTKNANPQQRFEPLESSSQIATALNDTNGWRRNTALRLATERQLKLTQEDFGRLGQPHSDPLSIELHSALLSGLEDGKTALTVLTSTSARHQENVDRWTSRMIANRSLIFDKLKSQDVATDARSMASIEKANLNSTDPMIRLQSFLLGARSEGDISKQLQTIAESSPLDEWLSHALLIAAKNSSGALLKAFVASKTASSQPNLIHRLAAITGRRGDVDEVAVVLNSVAATTTPAVQTAILTGLASGLPRHQGPLQAKSLGDLLNNPPPAAQESVVRIHAVLHSAEECAADRSRAADNRTAAISLISSQSLDSLIPLLPKLLQAGESTSVQIATLNAVRATARPEVAEAVLEHWNGLAPAARSTAVGLLMARTATTSKMLGAMQAGTIPSAIIDIDQRVRLLQHRDEQVRSLAGEVFGGVVSTNRKAVADEYQSALSLDASAKRGAAVFEKTCSKCHKIDGKGHNVGPDISDTRNRSRDALLYDILDPNRRVDPQFSEYIVVTSDGLTFNGLLVSDTETQVVLRQPEGKEQTILRNDIEEMQATSKSLMPEGIEKDVNVQQMADLLEFLKGR